MKQQILLLFLMLNSALIFSNPSMSNEMTILEDCNLDIEVLLCTPWFVEELEDQYGCGPNICGSVELYTTPDGCCAIDFVLEQSCFLTVCEAHIVFDEFGNVIATYDSQCGLEDVGYSYVENIWTCGDPICSPAVCDISIEDLLCTPWFVAELESQYNCGPDICGSVELYTAPDGSCAIDFVLEQSCFLTVCEAHIVFDEFGNVIATYDSQCGLEDVGYSYVENIWTCGDPICSPAVCDISIEDLLCTPWFVAELESQYSCGPDICGSVELYTAPDGSCAIDFVLEQSCFLTVCEAHIVFDEFGNVIATYDSQCGLEDVGYSYVENIWTCGDPICSPAVCDISIEDLLCTSWFVAELESQYNCGPDICGSVELYTAPDGSCAIDFVLEQSCFLTVCEAHIVFDEFGNVIATYDSQCGLEDVGYSYIENIWTCGDPICGSAECDISIEDLLCTPWFVAELESQYSCGPDICGSVELYTAPDGSCAIDFVLEQSCFLTVCEAHIVFDEFGNVIATYDSQCGLEDVGYSYIENIWTCGDPICGSVECDISIEDLLCTPWFVAELESQYSCGPDICGSVELYTAPDGSCAIDFVLEQSCFLTVCEAHIVFDEFGNVIATYDSQCGLEDVGYSYIENIWTCGDPICGSVECDISIEDLLCTPWFVAELESQYSCGPDICGSVELYTAPDGSCAIDFVLEQSCFLTVCEAHIVFDEFGNVIATYDSQCGLEDVGYGYIENIWTCGDPICSPAVCDISIEDLLCTPWFVAELESQYSCGPDICGSVELYTAPNGSCAIDFVLEQSCFLTVCEAHIVFDEFGNVIATYDSQCGLEDVGYSYIENIWTCGDPICDPDSNPNLPPWDIAGCLSTSTQGILIDRESHNIDANLDGIPLDTEDWIGIFYVDGPDTICQDAIKFPDVNEVGALTACLDNFTTPEKDGFALNERMLYRIYKDGVEYRNVNVQYFPIGSFPGGMLPSAGAYFLGDTKRSYIQFINEENCFDIPLKRGPLGTYISSYVLPTDRSIEHIFNPYDDIIQSISDDQNNAWTLGDPNTSIDDWADLDAFYVTLKTNIEESSMRVCGENVNPNLIVDVDEDVRYLGFPYSSPIPVTEAFEDDSELNVMQWVNEMGLVAHVFPETNPAFDMQPGVGYRIYALSESEIQYRDGKYLDNGCTQLRMKLFNSLYLSHVRVSKEVQNEMDLDSGDEFAICDVNGNVLSSKLIDGYTFTIAVEGDDVMTGTNEGAVEGQPLIARIYRSSIKAYERYDLFVEDGQLQFESNVHKNVSTVKRQLVGSNNIVVYPNPFVNSFTISGDLDKLVSWDLMDATGDLIAHRTVEGDINSFQLGNKLAPGIYFLRLNFARYSDLFKVVKLN